MNEAKSFASLTPGLLARKGAARPAMRPQLQPLSFEEQHRMVFGTRAPEGHAAADDLGWNDMGHDRDAAAHPEVHAPAPAHTVRPPLPFAGLTPLGTTAGAEAEREAEVPPAAERQPEVHRQIEAISAALSVDSPAPQRVVETVPAEPSLAVSVAMETAPVPAPRPTALAQGRKAAFTLRLDSHRHLRLRLASTLENRSAQQVVTEALDRYLASVAGLEQLARRARS